MDIASIIKSRRAKLKISQVDLADLSGVSICTIKDIERGVGNPSLSVLEGTLSFANGTVEEIAVAGTAKVKGGAVLGLDVNLNDRCDTIVANSIDLSEASAENPIVLNLNVVRKGLQGRLLFMTSSSLTADDVEKFVISGVESECWSVRYDGGNLYIAPYRSFMIIIR